MIFVFVAKLFDTTHEHILPDPENSDGVLTGSKISTVPHSQIPHVLRFCYAFAQPHYLTAAAFYSAEQNAAAASYSAALYFGTPAIFKK